ncbi:MAG: trans-2-enoyl-CoA reductase family protein, partial [Spirochaetales bacterium]|nr:trans-2-enoyl-CoA reductase family protein [Spirochaetales bacterium]
MIIKPMLRSNMCFTSHPEGCDKIVKEQIDYVKTLPTIDGVKNVLIVGASTGYGLSSRICAAWQMKANTVGIFFERNAEGTRTASAGLYNSVAFEKYAAETGNKHYSINGDAFSHEIKKQTIDLIKKEFGKIDLVVYSIASPKRTNPDTGEVTASFLRTIGEPFNTRTLNINTGKLTQISLNPATEEEIAKTVYVMGGEDWKMWIDALQKADALSDNVKTVAYSYIGPKQTAPIYRNGTIGKAKEDLERTAHELCEKMADINGKAYVSVNKGLVTQASSAIPAVPLYISILYKVMKNKGLHEKCIHQIARLFKDFLYNKDGVPTDEEGRIRIDDWEMREDVQN